MRIVSPLGVDRRVGPARGGICRRGGARARARGGCSFRRFRRAFTLGGTAIVVFVRRRVLYIYSKTFGKRIRTRGGARV